DTSSDSEGSGAKCTDMVNDSTLVIAKKTRWYRKWHRRIGLFVMVFLLIISITGILLVWKKNSGGRLLADTQKGTSTTLIQWKSFDELATAAKAAVRKKHGQDVSVEISRIDARPDKGMVKVIFEGHYHAVQLDATTANVLLYEERRADFIEQIHDGSILDNLFSSNGYSKLIYGSFAGLGLLLLTISGFWLWYNPKRITKKKRMGRVSAVPDTASAKDDA
ncbi:MAG: PepSY domain-containing protein, partial [Chitinophagaceae bacterium]|nr:PepSY domain-containing protein [Chitinophagaceae bacterium]